MTHEQTEIEEKELSGYPLALWKQGWFVQALGVKDLN